MKILAAILGALIILIQYPLWVGKGGWLRAWEVDRQLEAQRVKNSQLESRNASLAAEVRDLKQGTEAIEERARQELGMVRHDEIFFQYVNENRGQSPVPQTTPESPASR
ncbi:MAG TPA: cell division protein FtsB [Burkholderiales bacterium]|nr:cell division protein FtsB [Burkholderiales bacterium]